MATNCWTCWEMPVFGKVIEKEGLLAAIFSCCFSELSFTAWTCIMNMCTEFQRHRRESKCRQNPFPHPIRRPFQPGQTTKIRSSEFTRRSRRMERWIKVKYRLDEINHLYFFLLPPLSNLQNFLFGLRWRLSCSMTRERPSAIATYYMNIVDAGRVI